MEVWAEEDHFQILTLRNDSCFTESQDRDQWREKKKHAFKHAEVLAHTGGSHLNVVYLTQIAVLHSEVNGHF